MTRAWNLPERAVTPEAALRSRRRFLKWFGMGAVAAGAGLGLWWQFGGSDTEVLTAGQVPTPGAELFAAARNGRWSAIDRSLTAEADAARYCNFYEFSSGKQVWRSV